MNKENSFFFQKVDSKQQNVDINDFFQCNSTLIVKREDQLHDYVSGNKFRKLKYNLREAKIRNFGCVLTFGGAYSNHIAAVAAAGYELGLNTIGIIRGDEISDKIGENPTLSYAQGKGMKLHFITRKAYGQKGEKIFIDDLKQKYGDFYLIPEGGTNELAVKGCEEILNKMTGILITYAFLLEQVVQLPD